MLFYIAETSVALLQGLFSSHLASFSGMSVSSYKAVLIICYSRFVLSGTVLQLIWDKTNKYNTKAHRAIL